MSEAERGAARLGKARPGLAWNGNAVRGKAWQGMEEKETVNSFSYFNNKKKWVRKTKRSLLSVDE